MRKREETRGKAKSGDIRDMPRKAKTRTSPETACLVQPQLYLNEMTGEELVREFRWYAGTLRG